MYKKRYNLKELQKIIKELQKSYNYVDLEKLLFEIGYDPLDVNMFYIKEIKHRVRYERETNNR